MQIKRSVILALALIVTAVTAPAFADGVRAAIETANSKFAELAAKGDGTALAELYVKDAAVMPAGAEPVRGRSEIAKFWQGAFSSGVAGIELKTVEVYGQGATASEVGEYTLKDKAGKTLDHGKFIVIWRRVGGEWKLLRDMFSSNSPPPK